MKNSILIAILVVGFPTLACADIKNAMQSVCRVTVTYKEVSEDDPEVKVIKYAAGTGVIYQEDEKKYWIMTAGHVVDKEDVSKIEVEFFAKGFQTTRFEVKKAWLNYTHGGTNDLAILHMEKASLGRWHKPTVMPIAPRTRKLKVHQVVFSTGCPKGSWPTTFLGHIRSTQGSTFTFVPCPHKGRSGSPVFDENGTEIIGIVIWQDPERHQYGTAISVAGIYRFTNWGKSKR
tara:strand:- start:2646 stop:3341 length:696 start_codon:yes stop_codon:yes gene_type:complete